MTEPDKLAIEQTLKVLNSLGQEIAEARIPMLPLKPSTIETELGLPNPRPVVDMEDL